jgi:transposase
MRKSPKFSPGVIELAVSMVFDAKDRYSSQWAAIESIAGKRTRFSRTAPNFIVQSEHRSQRTISWLIPTT